MLQVMTQQVLMPVARSSGADRGRAMSVSGSAGGGEVRRGPAETSDREALSSSAGRDTGGCQAGSRASGATYGRSRAAALRSDGGAEDTEGPQRRNPIIQKQFNR